MKTRPRLLTALATAHMRQGDIEEACQLGTDALGLATCCKRSAPTSKTCGSSASSSSRGADSSPVRSLDERLALAG